MTARCDLGPWWLRLLARGPLALFRAAGWPVAALLLLLAHRRRRVAARNLRLCFPHAPQWQRHWWLMQTFLYFAQTFLDRIWLWHASPARVRARLRIHDPHGVLTTQRPLVCFAPHFYGLDAAWTGLTQQTPLLRWMTLYTDQRNPRIDAWVLAGRSRFGSPRVLSRRDGTRAVLRNLKESYALYLLPDMDLGMRDAVFADFFGVPTATVTSLGRFADAASAAVVTLSSRVVRGGYLIEVGPPWANYPSGHPEADARQMNAALERLILTMPGQYHWLHRRFKSRPPGHPPVYSD